MSPAASDVLVSDVVGVVLFLSDDWLSLCEEKSLRGDDSKFARLDGQDFELDWSEVSPDDKSVANVKWSGHVLEVGNEMRLDDVSGESLDGVLVGKDVDFLEIGDCLGWTDSDQVSQLDFEVSSRDLIDGYFSRG